MSLADRTLGASPASIWEYATRTLTSIIPLFGFQVVTNRVSVPASGTLNVQPSAGKAGLLMFGSSMSDILYRYYDGTNLDLVYNYLTGAGAFSSPCIVVCNSRYAQANNIGAAAKYVSYVELAWQVS